MGQELRDSEKDAELFGEHALDIQKANHAYLETAQQQIEQLESDDRLHETVATSAEQVGKISDQFDSILEQGLEDEDARACLLAKSDELNEKVSEVHQELATKAEPTEAVRGEASMMATLDDLLSRLDLALAEDERTPTGLAVMIRADPPAEKGLDTGVLDGVNTKVAALLQGAMEDPQDAAPIDQGRFMMLFDQTDLQAVTDRVESLRREIAETTFVRGDLHLHTTITCAIADLPGAESREEIKRRLEEAMAESGRLGRNRTFHHDGTFPTPIVPEDNSVTPRTVEF
jgi:GGDEF domain-containing protein